MTKLIEPVPVEVVDEETGEIIQSPSQSHSHGEIESNSGVVFALVIGCIALLIIIVLCVVMCVRRNRMNGSNNTNYDATGNVSIRSNNSVQNQQQAKLDDIM